MKVIAVESRMSDLFRLGEVESLWYRNREYFELTSVARLLQKIPAHVENWLTCNGYWAHEFLANGRYVRAVIWTTFCKLVEYEAKTADNPIAHLIQREFFDLGMKSLMDKAEAAGLDYFEAPTGKVHFQRIDGQRLINLDDLAAVIGEQPDDVLKTVQSKEFHNSVMNDKQLELDVRRQRHEQE